MDGLNVVRRLGQNEPRFGARRRFSAGLVAISTLMLGITGLSPSASAAVDTTAPPTPRGVEVEANQGGGGGDADIALNGESGSLSNISSSRRAWVSSTAKNGSGGITIDSQSEPGYVRWGSEKLAGNNAYAAARFWVRLDSQRSGESVDLFTIANAQNNRNFDFFVTGDTRKFKWDIFYSSNDESNFQVNYGQWYLVEVLLDFKGSEHTAQVRIDGVNQGTIRSNGVDTLVRRVSIGSYTSKTHKQHYDDLAVNVGTSPLGWVNPGDGGQDTNTVTWDRVTDAGGSGLRIYQVWRNGDWYGYVPSGTTRYVDTNPVAGARYQVRAEDNAGNKSSWSTPVGVGGDPGGPDRQAPSTPSGLRVSSQAGNATLTWNAVSDQGGSGLEGYQIWRNGSWYGWRPPSTTTFVDTNPVDGARYQLRAEDNAGNASGWSAPRTAN